jgi:hypothetical protein
MAVRKGITPAVIPEVRPTTRNPDRRGSRASSTPQNLYDAMGTAICDLQNQESVIDLSSSRCFLTSIRNMGSPKRRKGGPIENLTKDKLKVSS